VSNRTCNAARPATTPCVECRFGCPIGADHISFILGSSACDHLSTSCLYLSNVMTSFANQEGDDVDMARSMEGVEK
jgi:hypothetical protein